MNSPDFHELRERMVQKQIQARGITNASVLEAMRKVPRHEFVPEAVIDRAYEDCPLPIGKGQTVSQPYMVALMTQCLVLNKNKCVIEIGTGSGYQTAILAELSKEVSTIERIEELFDQAKIKLENLEYTNIKTYLGDGSSGHPDQSQLFDAIMITAATPARPEHLFSQLADQGRLVVPVGDRMSQMLTLFIKNKDQVTEEQVCGCTFVPLVGEFGWSLQ